MDVLRINHKHIPNDLKESVGCIGYFDGFHKGHVTLVKNAIALSKERNLESAIITFDPDPWSIFKPDLELKHLMSLADKIELAKNLEVDHFYLLTFTKDFASLNYDLFHEVLYKMHVNTLVCGFDFQYGKKNSGNVKTLSEQSLFDVHVVDSVNDNDLKISSSRIEPLIEQGKLEVANALFGFIYSIYGKVVHGFKRGSSILHIPTANLAPNKEYVLPKPGVYAGAVSVDLNMYIAMINIGSNPTFENELVTIEAHILDFNKNIYDKHARFYFYSRIRDEIKFNSIDQLKTQLHEDIDTTRQTMMNNIEILEVTAKTWNKNLFE